MAVAGSQDAILILGFLSPQKEKNNADF